MRTKVLLSCFFLSILLVSCVKEPEPIKVTGITLNSENLLLYEEETADLVATISPKDADNQTVLWSSSNGSVASVNNGKVTALKAGATTITAKSDDGGFTASCAVTVVSKTIEVSSITLSKTELTLTEGESETLVATVKPDDATDKTISWSSSDASIATVEDGKVTAVKEGSATITAKAGDKTAKCSVKVEKKVIPVESVTINKTEIEMFEGETEELVATVKPDDASDKTVTWSTSDASIATVEEGKIVAIKAGTTTISAKAGDKTATCNVSVKHDPMKDAITFADTNIKAALIKAFDENGDGELSYGEAAKATSIEGVFGTTKTYTSFDEFQYFTGVNVVPSSIFEGWTITSIIIPESVNSFGSSAFKDCVKLSSLIIPGSITSLSSELFMGCSSLSSITIPDSVTEIGSKAFYGCTGLSSLAIPGSVSKIGDSAFCGCSNLLSINIPDCITSIGSSTFRGCSSLTSITIPNNVTSIGLGAFASCSSLSSITIPDGIYKLEQEVFAHCSSLTSIAIPKSITIIGPLAFYDCTGLSSVEIPESVTGIGSTAFCNCNSLKSITVLSQTPPSGGSDMFWKTNNCPIYVPSESVEAYKIAQYWSDYADRIQAYSEENRAIVFADSKLKERLVARYDTNNDGELSYAEAAAVTSIDGAITIKTITSFDEFQYFTGVTVIPDDCFSSWTKLNSIVLPKSIKSIGSHAFSDCLSLPSLVIPDGVDSIGASAFSDCSKLSSVIIPNTVTSIGSKAFYSCSSLASVSIPNSVTSIEERLFTGCSSLISVVIPNSVKSIGKDAFLSCSNLASVVIPNSVTTIGNGAFYYCSSLTSVFIPNSVTSIGVDVFRSCPKIESITVDAGNSSFDSRNNCNAIIETKSNCLIVGCKNTIIPQSIQSIGFGAFCECSGLTSIIIPESVTKIGDQAFSGCSSLASLVIPESISSIGSNTFSSCSSLTSIVIPESVTKIEQYAFYGCIGLSFITVMPTTPPKGSSEMFDKTNDCPIYVPSESVEAYKAQYPWTIYSNRIKAISD